MRTIPRRIIKHCGQRGAQLAQWGFANGRTTGRVEKWEWQAMHLAGIYPGHIITENGQVIVIDAMGLRQAIRHIAIVHGLIEARI